MDKGFNDDELEDIMNEIESLEKEFSDNGNDEDHEPSLEEVAESVASLDEEERESSAEHSLLDQVAKMPVESVVPQQKIEKFDDDSHHNIVNLEKTPFTPSPKTSANNTAMNFKIEGDMQMELSFSINGSEVSLQISDNGFEIELEGGAKFTLPVGQASTVKKVA